MTLASLIPILHESETGGDKLCAPKIRLRIKKKPLYKRHILKSLLLHFYLRREENLSVEDKITGPKCVHYLEVPLYADTTRDSDF